MDCNEFTSLCPLGGIESDAEELALLKGGAPDFGIIRITYVPAQLVLLGCQTYRSELMDEQASARPGRWIWRTKTDRRLRLHRNHRLHPSVVATRKLRDFPVGFAA